MNHQIRKSTASSATSSNASVNVNHIVERIAQCANRRHRLPVCIACCLCDDKRKRESITRIGSDRRVFKVKTALSILLVVILAMYLLVILRITFRMIVADRRKPRNVLRHIQMLLQKKKKVIIRQPSVLRASTNIGIGTSKRGAGHDGSKVEITNEDFFIIFDADMNGQGNGNLISGLLASQLLGDEFQRIVCINPIFYSSFLSVFDYINPVAQTKCPIILDQINASSSSHTPHQVTVINWLGPADECYLKDFMSDRTKKIVHFLGNTYPRWPPLPEYYFFHYYQPKQILLDNLPYSYQPKTVVHLREPDEAEFDARAGLDKASLVALGDLLPKSPETYLVTNNVAYYERFEKCCSWSHAAWKSVKHSALPSNDRSIEEERQQNLQMWSDWYTILMADVVYHTHSDFSISAIHWMNNYNSCSIKGYNTETKKFETEDESWRRDGETIPLSQRTIEGTPGTTNELRMCGIWSAGVPNQ